MSQKITKVKNVNVLPSNTVKLAVSRPKPGYLVNEQPVKEEEFQRTYPDALAANPIFLDTKKLLPIETDEVVTEVFESTDIDTWDENPDNSNDLPKKTPELFRVMREVKQHVDYISSMPLSLLTKAAAASLEAYQKHQARKDKYSEEAIKEYHAELDAVLKPIFKKYKENGFGFGPKTEPAKPAPVPGTGAVPGGVPGGSGSGGARII